MYDAGHSYESDVGPTECGLKLERLLGSTDEEKHATTAILVDHRSGKQGLRLLLPHVEAMAAHHCQN